MECGKKSVEFDNKTGFYTDNNDEIIDAVKNFIYPPKEIEG